MRRPKIVSTLIAFILLGGVMAIVSQHSKIAALERAQSLAEVGSQALTRENRELIDAQKRVEDELRIARVELAAPSRQRTATTALASPLAPVATTSTIPPVAAIRPPLPSLNTPAERVRLHGRYDRFLFQQRGLTPAQAERIIDLWIAQNEVRADLQAAVEAQSLTAGPEVEKIRNSLNEPLTREIRQILGEDGYAAYHDDEVTSAYREIVNGRLQPRFSEVGAPLTEPQLDQLARILSANKTLVKAKPTDLGSRIQFDWPRIARDSAGLLTPAQLAALQAYSARE